MECLTKKRLSIDLETYSDIDISKTGSYRYIDSENFEILLFAYAFDNEPVRCIDLAAGEAIPDVVLEALVDEKVIKTAFNAAFEWYAINKVFGPITGNLPIEQWRCTMAQAAYNGYPMSLAQVGAVMQIEQEKMSVGKALIRLFCCPVKPTKTNGNRTRIKYFHEPEKWNLFKRYNIRDVEAEREIKDKLKNELPYNEQKLWEFDILMNARGIQLDKDLVTGALDINNIITTELLDEAMAITKLDNPQSVAQLKKWLSDALDTEITSLNKTDMPDIIELAKEDKQIAKVLQIRQELGKTSVKKYITMQNAAGTDWRVRGLLQYYGANRTGRWAGRLVQVQNLPRNYLDDLGFIRGLIKEKDINTIKMIYGNVPDTLSQLIRTAFIAKDDYKLVVADFSAIEARVIAWLAEEKWVIDVFKTTGKIYEATASQMFGIPLEKIKKGNPEYAYRAKGKVATLALGYQGGPKALIAMGALNNGLTEEELPDIVERWRNANPNIVKLWYIVEKCAVNALSTRKPVTIQKGITFYVEDDALAIRLPSGRSLYYRNAKLVPSDFYSGQMQVAYDGLNQTNKKWESNRTYGGKLTENLIQAIARDVLANSLMNLEAKGYHTVAHIHDEAIIEVPNNTNYNLQDAIDIMTQLPEWAVGLPLNAAGFESEFYMKD